MMTQKASLKNCTETPMSDRVDRFWRLLETEHVRIRVDLMREIGHDSPDGPTVYWDCSTFSDYVAKALIKDRNTRPASAGVREALESAERKLSAYVGVCKGDKELTEVVLPMLRSALSDHGVQNSAAGAGTKSDGGEPMPERTQARLAGLDEGLGPMQAIPQAADDCAAPSDPSPGQRKAHNDSILARMRGVEQHPATPESDADPRNPTQRNDNAPSPGPDVSLSAPVEPNRNDRIIYWLKKYQADDQLDDDACEELDALLKVLERERSHPQAPAISALTRPLGGFVQEETPLRIQELPGSDRQATEAEADSAIKCLRLAIDAAENSNQAGENAVVKAASAIGWRRA